MNSHNYSTPPHPGPQSSFTQHFLLHMLLDWQLPSFCHWYQTFCWGFSACVQISLTLLHSGLKVMMAIRMCQRETIRFLYIRS